MKLIELTIVTSQTPVFVNPAYISHIVEEANQTIVYMAGTSVDFPPLKVEESMATILCLI